MIEYLSGKVLRKFPSHLILDVNGVGYGVEMPTSAMASVPGENAPLSLWIYTRVKEDVLKLYGFISSADKAVFEILLNINGIGPKAALAILSTLTVRSLRLAIERREPEILETVPGVGKRMAEKIVVELQNKVDKFPNYEGVSMVGATSTPSMNNLDTQFADLEDRKTQDLCSALENLGFKKKDILPVVDKLMSENSQDNFPDLVRRALAVLKPLDKSKYSRDLEQLF